MKWIQQRPMQLPVIPEELPGGEEDASTMNMDNIVSHFWRPFLERILEQPAAREFYEVVPKPELKLEFTHTAPNATTTMTPGEFDMTPRNLRTCCFLMGNIVAVISELEKWIEAHARVWSAYSLLHRGCRSIDAKLVQYLSIKWLEHDTTAQKLLEKVNSKRERWFEFESRPGIVGRFQGMVWDPPDCDRSHDCDQSHDMDSLHYHASDEPPRQMAQLNRVYVQMEALASMVKKSVCSLYTTHGELYAAILDSRPDFFSLEDAGPAGIDLERTKAGWDSRNEPIFRLRVEKLLARRDIPVMQW